MDESRAQELFQSGQIDRRTFLRLMAGLASGGALAALGVGCAPGATPTAVPQATATTAPAASAVAPTAAPSLPSGEINIALGSEWDTMDIHVTQGGNTPGMMGHMMDGLLRRVQTGERVPHLVTSAENEDELNWILHLQEGVEFHNGEKWDASVLKYNFDRMADPALGAMYGGERFTLYYRSCEVVDDYTARWTTQEPLGPMLRFLPENFLMMSPKAISELGDDVVNQAVGSGPFKFVEWTPGDKLVMEANEQYWMGPPKLARVVLRPVVEAATRLTELKTGRAHIIDQVPAENIAELEGAGGIQIVQVPSEMGTYIELNCDREYFKDVKVRQALNYAIDRDSIVQHIMLGAGEPMVGFLTAAHEGNDPDLEPYPYDPDKARSLLEQAGYPNGFSFTLSGPNDRYFKDKEILEAVAFQLEQIGVTVELNILEWGTYIGEFVSSPRVYDAGMIGFGDGGNAWTSIQMSTYSKAQAAGYYGYQNPEFEALFEEAMRSFDEEERELKLRQCRQILYDECPFIYLVTPTNIFAVQDNVHDFFPWPDGDFWLREGDGCYLS